MAEPTMPRWPATKILAEVLFMTCLANWLAVQIKEPNGLDKFQRWCALPFNTTEMSVRGVHDSFVTPP